jgi:hypothetical protein
MNVNLHIERLVLEGVTLDRYGTPLLEQALQTELMRLFSEKNLATSLAGGMMPSLRGESIRTEPKMAPSRLGSAIAQSVYGAIVK